MKVIYQKETKRLPELKVYEDLVSATTNAFNFHEMVVFGDNMKFYYIDQDGDIISISCQGDLDEAYQVLNGSIRLVCASNNEEARQVLGESAINRSEILN
jgi:hypothetical protein